MRYCFSLLLLLLSQMVYADGLLSDMQELTGLDASQLDTQALQVHDMYLMMDELDAEVLFRKEPNDMSSFDAEILVGEDYRPATVKVKGSFTRNFLKKSLAIKLAKGNEWRGMRTIAMNAMSTDPSNMREKLAWELIHALNIPSPDVAYVRLHINNEFIGVFLQIEWITDNTFARYGLERGGTFLHPDDVQYCGDMSLENNSRLEQCWFNLSGRDSSEVFKDFGDVVEQLNTASDEEFADVLAEHFNVDSVLNWLVVNAIVSSGDTYNKNYFLYQNPANDKWYVIPWDYDLSFGRNADPVMRFPKSILNDNFYYMHTPDLGLYNPLKNRTLANDELMERYRMRLEHVLGIRNDGSADDAFAWFKPAEFVHRVSEIRVGLAEDMRNDRYQPQGDELTRKQVDAITWYASMRFHFLRELLTRPSPFGTMRWKYGVNYPFMVEKPPVKVPLTLTSNVNMTVDSRDWQVAMDIWLSRPLGLVHIPGLEETTRVRLEVETEQPPLATPPGMSSSDCVQRTWYVDLKQPGREQQANLYFDYLQENSIHHELGLFAQSADLGLWVEQRGEWRALPTDYNDLSNTLVSKGVPLHYGEVSRFVACIRAGQAEE